MRFVRLPARPRGRSQRLVRGEFEIFFLELVPDRLVDPLRITLAGWKEIDHQQMNAVLK